MMNTGNDELAALLDPIVELAQQAGAAILTVYNSNEFSVEEKDDKSPLTAADMASHHTIVKGLTALTADIPVHVPVTGVTYMACQGQGAFKQEPGGPRQAIRVRKLGDGPVMVVGSRSHRGESLNNFLDKLGEHDMVGMGSSLKLCLVAEGAADIYPRLGPTSEWDTAAAQCVVEQAGGFVTDTAMKPLRYNTKDSLLNPFFLVFGDETRDWSTYL
jgi:3'(2'), 5'-bisphosphate nucleotidase